MDKPQEKQLYRYGGLPADQRKKMFDFDDEPYVCTSCIPERGLHEYVESRAISKRCDFCGRRSRNSFAAPLVEIAAYIQECMLAEYDEAGNCLSYESAEGGFLGRTFDTEDLISGLVDLPNDEDGTLLKALVGRIGDQVWCKRDPYGMSEAEVLQFSWEQFCERIKYEQRYFFLAQTPDDSSDDLLSPADMLEELARWVRELDLVVSVPAGTRFFRARFEKPGETLSRPSELGPPPRECATQSNRMSPPGIVMFYASDNPGTALRETVSASGTFVVAEFEVTKDVRMLDLTRIPPVPSLFEPVPEMAEYNPRPVLIFLHMFTTDLAKPRARDDRVHIEYVPTQVVTEFFRTMFKDHQGSIDGIRYASSRHLSNLSVVLFASREDVYLEEGQNSYLRNSPWLRLLGSQRYEITLDELDNWDREPKPPSPDDFV
jgi:hypothetical protein